MLKALIIDDEQSARDALSMLLTNYCPYVTILGTTDSVKAGSSMILNLKPNLLFLDVDMRGETGFDLLQKFKNPPFKVIFVTAHNEYALNAIKFSALDYLLKPINDVELVNAVQKAKLQLEYEHRVDNLINLFETLKNPRDKKNKIAVATQPGLELVPVEDIIRCEASGGYTVLHLTNKKHIVSSKDLKSFNELLDEYDFYRIHDSHLISYAHIAKVLNEDGGVVLTTDGNKIPISRRRKNDFQAWLKGF